MKMKLYVLSLFVGMAAVCGMAAESLSLDGSWSFRFEEGKPLEEVLTLTNQAVVEALDGLPAHKLHCSVLAEEAVKAALRDYYKKNGIAYDHELLKDTTSCDHCEV